MSTRQQCPLHDAWLVWQMTAHRIWGGALCLAIVLNNRGSCLIVQAISILDWLIMTQRLLAKLTDWIYELPRWIDTIANSSFGKVVLNYARSQLLRNYQKCLNTLNCFNRWNSKFGPSLTHWPSYLSYVVPIAS